MLILDCWFFLEYEHNGETHTIKRNTSNQKEIWIDEQKYSLNKFKKILGEQLNFIVKDYVTVRTKLSQVLRYKKNAFNNPIDFGDGSNEFQHIINILDSLNIDLELAYNKIKNHNEYIITNKVIKELKAKDIKEVLVDTSKDIDIEKRKITKKILEKELQLKKFKVSDNISELKRELSEQRIMLNNSLNQLNILRRHYSKIKESLESNIYYSEEKVVNAYGVILYEILVRHLYFLQ